MVVDIIIGWYQKSDELEINQWYYDLIQCFKTRPGPAGRPGTRATRVCGRVGSKRKIGWELARSDLVDPGPGTRPTRPNPAETRVYFFLYPHARNDVVLAFYN